MPDSLWTTFRRLRGNARGAVLTEPLWGIPYNLFAPYASVYMLALGLSDSQVGMVISVSMAGQVAMALLSGIITDRMGRRRATLVFDLLAWSVPCLIWAGAQNLHWFLVAGLVNSLRRVPDIAWNCLVVEDTDPDDLVHFYAMVYLAGQLAVFAAPLAGLLILHVTLVPAVRGLYLLGFAMMTAKFVTMNLLVHETRQGLVRMDETRHQPLADLLREYGAVARRIAAAPSTVYTMGLMVMVSIVTMVQSTFWSIIATERIGIPAAQLAYYPFARSLLMLLFLAVVVPRLRGVTFARPMQLALAGYVASQALLVVVPPGGYLLLLASTLLESGSYAVVATQTERLTAVNIEAAERARIVAVAHLTVLVCTTPFGWIAGLLSQTHRALPFALNVALLLTGFWLVRRLRQAQAGQAAIAPTAGADAMAAACASGGG